MKSVLFLVALLLPLGATAAVTDRTETVLEKLRGGGMAELKQADLGGVHVYLHLTNGAKAIITARAFDLKDDAFDLSRYGDFVVDRFRSAVEYFTRLVPAAPVREFHIVIEDLGEDRKMTLSQATVGSRVISVDVRRWHKLYRGQRAFLADLTSIHEFTHVNNYFLDSNETKRHRELVAVVFEVLGLVRTQGADVFVKTYLEKVVGPAGDRELVLGDDYRGMSPLRYITHSFVSKTLSGTYGVQVDRQSALEIFARNYLEGKATGAAGFDQALRAGGFRDRAGGALTLERVQHDLYDELKPVPRVSNIAIDSAPVTVNWQTDLADF